MSYIPLRKILQAPHTSYSVLSESQWKLAIQQGSATEYALLFY